MSESDLDPVALTDAPCFNRVRLWDAMLYRLIDMGRMAECHPRTWSDGDLALARACLLLVKAEAETWEQRGPITVLESINEDKRLFLEHYATSIVRMSMGVILPDDREVVKAMANLCVAELTALRQAGANKEKGGA